MLAHAKYQQHIGLKNLPIWDTTYSHTKGMLNLQNTYSINMECRRGYGANIVGKIKNRRSNMAYTAVRGLTRLNFYPLLIHNITKYVKVALQCF
jgi:hypothetical protein